MREKIEYFSIKCLLGIAKIVPAPLIYLLMRRITLFVYYADRKRRELTIANLTRAFPSMDKAGIKQLSKEVYTELSKTISEILLMYVGRFDIDSAVVNKEEVLTQLEKIRRNSSHGNIAMTAHFSNWELLAHFLAKHGFSMLVIGRKGNNRLIDENITLKFRKKYGNDTAAKDKALLLMAKRLKQNGNIGILIDQKAGAINSVKVDFFGQPAETTTSVAMLKLKFDPQVIPLFIARVSEGKYKIILKEPVEYLAEEESEEEKKIEKMTERYNQIMESVIRNYPSQWFWMHNRWRR
ncbi:MAG: lysophospholipid acyltransferase family protein [Sulfurimonas sp.]